MICQIFQIFLFNFDITTVTPKKTHTLCNHLELSHKFRKLDCNAIIFTQSAICVTGWLSPCKVRQKRISSLVKRTMNSTLYCSIQILQRLPYIIQIMLLLCWCPRGQANWADVRILEPINLFANLHSSNIIVQRVLIEFCVNRYST